MSSTKTKTKEEPKAAEVKAEQPVVKQQTGGAVMTAEDAALLEKYSGAGVSERREDSLVPFLYIAQKGSPQVNKRDPAYIEGLEPGMVFDTSTRRIWNAESDDEGPLLVQFFFEPAEVEWGIRGTPNAGFKGKHPADTHLIKEVREVQKEGGRGIQRILPNGNQLSTTRYHYFLLADEGRQVAYAASSSAINASRQLNTDFSNEKMRTTTGFRKKPSFAHLVRMRTRWKQNEMGDWFVPEFKIEGTTIGHPEFGWLLAEGAMLFEAASKSGVKTQDLDDGTINGTATDTSGGDPGYDPDANPQDHDNPI